MKPRHFSFAGVLVLAACGPQLTPARPTDVTPCQKELPAPVELTDAKQIDPREGDTLVLTSDADGTGVLAFQVDVSTRTARRVFKISPAQLSGVLITTVDKASTLNIIRPNPPPPPGGEDKL